MTGGNSMICHGINKYQKTKIKITNNNFRLTSCFLKKLAHFISMKLLNHNLFSQNMPWGLLVAAILVLAAMMPAYSIKADQRDSSLVNLFAELKSAESPEVGEEISNEIWQIWTKHYIDPALTQQMQMGIELMQSGQLVAANAVFTYLIDQDEKFAEAWNKRATVLFFMGEFEKAKYDIAQTLILENNHFGALAGLGMIEVHLGNPKAALEAYRRAALINPHLQDVKQAMSRLEEQLKGIAT